MYIQQHSIKHTFNCFRFNIEVQDVNRHVRTEVMMKLTAYLDRLIRHELYGNLQVIYFPREMSVIN